MEFHNGTHLMAIVQRDHRGVQRRPWKDDCGVIDRSSGRPRTRGLDGCSVVWIDGAPGSAILRSCKSELSVDGTTGARFRRDAPPASRPRRDDFRQPGQQRRGRRGGRRGGGLRTTRCTEGKEQEEIRGAYACGGPVREFCSGGSPADGRGQGRKRKIS